MRLDKLISSMGIASRTEITRAASSGLITVDGAVEKKTARQIDPKVNKVVYRGEEVVYREFTYVMLNKPQGYVCSTDDPRERTVLELLPERLRKLDLFPCGRLDKDTVGLVILTNNGQLAHRMLSPKHHVEKVYFFGSRDKVTDEDVKRLEPGIALEDGYVTKPAKIEMIEDKLGYITLTEGKYHQIKRMLEAVDNKITMLERIAFAGIPLDNTLGRGEWRYLSEDEEKKLEANGI